MPPKRGRPAKAAAAASPAKAASQTAASSRPRRAAAKEESAPTPAKKTPAKKAAAKTAPAKNAPKDATPTTKKRGRPAKVEEAEAEAEADPEPPKKRGRPSKTKTEEADVNPDPPKKRGRSSKAATAATNVPAVTEAEKAPPKKRGRPPKGGETTKIAEDDPAAAEQLEEELVDAVEAPSKRAPPVKKAKAGAKGKGRKAKAAAADADDVDDDVVGAAETADAIASDVDGDAKDDVVESGGKQYWLMKAEQIDRDEVLQDGSTFNTKFTIDNLRERNGPEPWDGVRNPTACKNMREMREGDLAFFYASGAKGKTLQPGITGIMEIVKEHEPDMSAFDEKHPYYVQNPKQRGTKENPKWSVVHVEFRKKLAKPVGLKELQQYKGVGGVLANMQEFTAARLSVSKVTEKEWNFIVNELVEGYEDEATPATGSKEPEKSNLTAGTKEVDMADPSLMVNDSPVDPTLLTSETAAPSVEVNDTSRPPSRSSQKPSSRPTSRASSKPPSRPVSRGSLAPPPRAQSRGRSRTPASRAGSVKPMMGVAEEMETVDE